MKKNFSLPIRYEQQQFEDDRFLKLKIYVMHDGINLNESNFNMDSIEAAKESIKNIPILAFVKESDGEDNKDFAGHEMELIFKDDEYKIRYLGRPIGVIPADNNNYRYETIDDRTYVVVDGYVWKDYANDALDILEKDGEKSQSMEITVDNYSFSDDGICNIIDYKYTGVCLLGDDVLPAMENARAEVMTTQVFNKSKVKSSISNIIQELTYSLNYENDENSSLEGGNEMTDKKKETFSLSSEQIEQELRRELSKAQKADDWGYMMQDYYLVDYLPDEKIVIAHDWDGGGLVGLDYTINGDVVSVDLESARRFKIEYVPMNADMEEENFSLVSKEYVEYQLNVKEKETEDKVKTEYATKIEQYEDNLSTLNEQFDSIKQEKEELEQFKVNKLQEEREVEENAIFERFSEELTEDEMKAVKDKSSEYSLEELEDKLFSIAGRKKVKFSVNKKKERLSFGLIQDRENNDKNVEKDVWAEQKEKYSSK